MAELPLDTRVALVTGSSRNLGAAVATMMAEQGAVVGIHFNRRAEEADSTARQIRARGGIAEVFQADATVPSEMRRLAAGVLARFGHVDILVNNLGTYSDVPFVRLPEDTWDLVFNTNVKSTYLLAQELGPRMRERGWGRIVNVASVSAFNRSQSIYSLAKAAVIHLTESLALELAPDVLVNAVAPSQIQESEEIDKIDPTFKQRRAAATPLGRLVTRAEISSAICLLCTDFFPSMTGQTLVLDGGWSIPVARQMRLVGTVE